MNLTVQIDELVLVGYPPSERYAIADALERSLAVLIVTAGLRSEGADRSYEGLSVRVAGLNEVTAPDKVGAVIAQDLYAALAAMLEERP